MNRLSARTVASARKRGLIDLAILDRTKLDDPLFSDRKISRQATLILYDTVPELILVEEQCRSFGSLESHVIEG